MMRVVGLVRIDLVLSELNLPTISPSDCENLLRPYSSQEIQDSLFSLAHDKSPGLDGFNAEFFRFIGLLWVLVLQRQYNVFLQRDIC